VDAQRVPAVEGASVTAYRLAAAVGGYNVDAAIFFGGPAPTPAARAAAQRQLGRLLVGATGVTLFARPTVVYTTGTTLFGSIESRRANEEVTIQAKDCGSEDFRVVAGITTHEGGGWSTVYYPMVNTTVRAVWKGEASPQVALKQRVRVFLDKRRSGNGFRAGVGARRSFWGKKVFIQRRSGGGWTNVKTVVLNESAPTTPHSGSWAQATFSLDVPKGTLVRAFLPLSQARPCYLSGASRVVRT
jgi:hypothetical protein